MPATFTYSPVQPLKGLQETRMVTLSYRALSPHGDGVLSVFKGIKSVPQTANSSLLTGHSSYTFSAKEKDSETGLSYFGSRYYSSDLSVWLSVDPMSDKYPSLSPYTYCANNPVRVVDPDGEEVYINGNAADDAVSQLNNKTSDHFKVMRNAETGLLSYEGKAKSKTDRIIKKAIVSKKETIHIEANNSSTFTDRNGEKHTYTKDDNGGNFYGGGAYGGSTVTGKHCDSYQYVNPEALSELDYRVGDCKSGGYMLHEFAEGYFSAKLGHYSKGDPVGGNNYKEAHGMANMYSGGGWKALMLDIPIKKLFGFIGLTRSVKIGYKRSDD